MDRKVLRREFIKYVSQNVFGMIGISIYIIADTFFISKSAGANGITVLNMALPIYGLIFAIGSMIGIGATTRAALFRSMGNDKYKSYFWNGIIWLCIISIPFVLAGIICPQRVIGLMGGDSVIRQLGQDYFRTFLVFTPFFMINYICNGYVRNDGNPNRAMMATISGSIFNIVFDYIFIFPMHMGMTGAALATGMAPIIGILVCCTHLCGSKCTWQFKLGLPSVKKLFGSASLGVSAFVGEMSSAVITAVFNFLLLGLAGNIGVAAYGVIANLALVAVAIYNGIAQGAQPLLSENHGKAEYKKVNYFLKLGIITSIGVSIIICIMAFVFTDSLVAIFNSEKSAELVVYAHTGLRLYFVGYLFAGLNIVVCSFFSAVSLAKQAAITSALRGFAAIIPCAVLMSIVFGINGLWSSFALAELITLIVGLILLKRNLR